MKRFAAISIFFALFLWITPYLWRTVADYTGIVQPVPYASLDSFKLLLTESGNVADIGDNADIQSIIDISPVDYVIGCLFAQIPVNYHEEALKAQAVCAYTYALRTVRNNQLFPDMNTEADLSDDSITCQPYFTAERAREYYGEDFDTYYEKVKEAAEYGVKHVITYNNEPIYSVYHSVSTGVTNTAYSVWGRDFPYLKSVQSEWDKEYINYECTAEISVENARVALLNYDRQIVMPVDYSKWFSDYSVNGGGYVEQLNAGGGSLLGGDAWRAFNLRSVCFKIEYTGTVFQITTKGYGHGAGMSQYGANYMAEKGYTAEEILYYYFTDVNITKI